MALPAQSSAQVNLFGLIAAAVILLQVSGLKTAWRSLYPGTNCSVAVGFWDLLINLSAFYSQGLALGLFPHVQHQPNYGLRCFVSLCGSSEGWKTGLLLFFTCTCAVSRWKNFLSSFSQGRKNEMGLLGSSCLGIKLHFQFWMYHLFKNWVQRWMCWLIQKRQCRELGCD